MSKCEFYSKDLLLLNEELSKLEFDSEISVKAVVTKINYGKPLPVLVEECAFNWFWLDVNVDNFAPSRCDNDRVVIYIVSCPDTLSLESFISKLGFDGYRPIDLWELLHIARDFPDLPRNTVIYGDESSRLALAECNCVPYLDISGQQRGIGLCQPYQKPTQGGYFGVTFTA